MPYPVFFSYERTENASLTLNVWELAYIFLFSNHVFIMRNFAFERNTRNIKFPCNLLQMLPMGHIQRLQAYYYYYFILRLLNHVIPRLKTLVKDDEENVYRLHKIIRTLIFNPTGTPRRIHVDTSKTKFRRISTSFPHTFSM